MRFRKFTVRCNECGHESTSTILVETETAHINEGVLACAYHAHDSAAGPGAPRGNVSVINSSLVEMGPLDFLPKYHAPGRLYQKPEGWREQEQELGRKLEEEEARRPRFTEAERAQADEVMSKYMARYR